MRRIRKGKPKYGYYLYNCLLPESQSLAASKEPPSIPSSVPLGMMEKCKEDGVRQCAGEMMGQGLYFERWEAAVE